MIVLKLLEPPFKCGTCRNISELRKKFENHIEIYNTSRSPTAYRLIIDDRIWNSIGFYFSTFRKTLQRQRYYSWGMKNALQTRLMLCSNILKCFISGCWMFSPSKNAFDLFKMSASAISLIFWWIAFGPDVYKSLKRDVRKEEVSIFERLCSKKAKKSCIKFWYT